MEQVVTELYRRYRPVKFKGVVGQEAAVSQLSEMLRSNRVPHALLFSGPSGCGKTTLARIMATKMGCTSLDLAEMNAAADRGIDDIRAIRSRMGMSPAFSKCRIWIVDECFPAGTPVGTPSGVKLIDRLRVGDVVTNVRGSGTVEKVFKNRVPLDKVTKLVFADGSVVFTTQDHLFLTESGWTKAKDLCNGICTPSLWRYNLMQYGNRQEDSNEQVHVVRGVIQASERAETEVLFQGVRTEAAEQEPRVWPNGTSSLCRMPEDFYGVEKEGWQEVLFKGVHSGSIELHFKGTSREERTRKACHQNLSNLRDNVRDSLLVKEDNLFSIVCEQRTFAQTGSSSKVVRIRSWQKDQRGQEAICCNGGWIGDGSESFGTYATDESYEPTGSYRENEGNQESQWNTSCLVGKARRQWAIYSSAEVCLDYVRWRGEWLDYGSPNQDRTQSAGWIWLPTCLQSRHRESGISSSNRDRRQWASDERRYLIRCQKDQEARRTRVVRAEVYQRGRNDASFVGVITDQDRARGFVEFYDLQISGHPSYFVNGFAVHNCHQLSKRAGGDAQTALLKMLEDTPAHVYFFLCTTDPDQLLKTIRTRCAEVKVRGLTVAELKTLIAEVLAKEGATLTETVVDKLIEAADQSARKALVLLHQIIGLASEEQQLQVLEKADAHRVAFDVAKALMWEKPNWGKVASIIAGLDTGEDWETLRRTVLAIAGGELLKPGGKQQRACAIINAFECDPLPPGKAGRALFARSAYELLRDA